MRRAALACSLLASLVGGSTSSAAGERAPDPFDHLVPPGAVFPGDRSDLLAHPSDLLLNRKTGPVDLADAERALLERAWGVPIPDWKAAVADAAAQEAGGPDGRYRVPIASSDFDGDGRGDAAFFDIELDPNAQWTRVGLTAHSGLGGRHLWTRDFGLPYDALVLSPGDLTGDGAEDVLIMVLRQTFDPEDLVCRRPTVCTFRDATTYRWELAVVSGADGSAAWDRTITGSALVTGGYAGQGPGLHVVHRFEAETGLLDIRRSDDVDGDGLDDFTLNLHDFRGHRAFNQRVWYQDARYDTRAEVLSGDTGATVLTRSIDDQAGAALLLPAGEATGDGRADLLWTIPTATNLPRACVEGCVDPSFTALRVELVDGSTGQARWQADVAEQGLRAATPVLTQTDLTGDARADVVIGIRRADGSEAAVTLSGADGSRAWSFDTLLTDPPTALGSIDGGAGSDVLFWEGWYPTEEEAPGVQFRIRLRRVDGATGEHRFTTQHDLGDPDAKLDTIYAYGVGDVNDDGVPDIGHALWHYDGWWTENGTASTVLRVESGADGTELLRAERDRKALLFAGGDFAPGGPNDLFEGSTPYNDTNFRFSVVAMPTGETLWSRTDVLYTAIFGSLRNPAGEGDDVVYGRTRLIQEPPRMLSRIDVVRGRTGGMGWGIGPDL